MFVPVKAKAGFQGAHHKKLIAASLLSTVLVCSLFICVIMNESNGASLTDAVHVKNENELKNAINNASKETTIALDKDITLTDTLTIPANKDIILTSNKVSGYYKLIGSSGKSTINIESSGLLKIDGIIVTHTDNERGRGVNILENGLLIMYSGEISGNIAEWIVLATAESYSEASGVYNSGTFEMHGGKISNNRSNGGSGGGVLNNGIFKMFGGEISGNTAEWGGGVYNHLTSSKCIFEMSGGKISNNKADTYGGGVLNKGTFTMSGGEITKNIGGGLVNEHVFTFNRLGGVISDNSGGDVSPPDSSNGSSGDNGGSSNGNDGTSNGDNGSSDENGGISNGDDKQFVGGFSLRQVVVICIIITVIIVSIVAVVLFAYFQKRIDQVVEEKVKKEMNR